MKYYSLIILVFIFSCGYGQYPNTRYKGNDFVADSFPCSIICYTTLPPTCDTFWCNTKDSALRLDVSNAEYWNHVTRHIQLVKDSGSYWFTKSGNDTIFVVNKTYIKDSVVYAYADTTIYFYWKQYLFYSHQKDKQLDIIRKQRNPSYKDYDRLMDSVVRYKLLIDKLKAK